MTMTRCAACSDIMRNQCDICAAIDARELNRAAAAKDAMAHRLPHVDVGGLRVYGLDAIPRDEAWLTDGQQLVRVKLDIAGTAPKGTWS